MRTAVLIPLALLAAAALAVAGPQDERGKAPGVGDPAPPFRLNDHAGKAVASPAFGEGAWTIVAFFPKSFTPG